MIGVHTLDNLILKYAIREQIKAYTILVKFDMSDTKRKNRQILNSLKRPGRTDL